MSKGKLIIIEGTDCSGKETQSKLLKENLIKEGFRVKDYSFPMYDLPTGKIIGGPYLGKPEINDSWFHEGATEVDPLVASLYYTADRRYTYLNYIKNEIDKNDVILLDRYVYSNFGHQGAKIKDLKEQDEFFDKLYELEFGICGLPKPDLTIFLHMPYEAAVILKKNRINLDGHESSESHLRYAEKTYLRLYKKYGWEYINCLKGNFIDSSSIKTIDEISLEVLQKAKKVLDKKL